MPNECQWIKVILLLAKNKNVYIVWLHAACFGRLETLWSWGKEVELSTDELLPTKFWEGFTSFELATEKNHVETL